MAEVIRNIAGSGRPQCHGLRAVERRKLLLVLMRSSLFLLYLAYFKIFIMSILFTFI